MPAGSDDKTKTDNLRRIAIDPLTRVEGHGKVTLLLDEDNHVQQARLHIVEFRGFERFIQGRPYWELPLVVQRLCGICPVSHHLAAAKALDQIVGVDQLTPTAEKMRRLMHYGQVLQSHALHFFHLASPDLVFGFDAEPARRNVLALIGEHPDIARQGVLLRKFGQEVIAATTGKRIHGNGAVAGGVNQYLQRETRDALQAQMPDILAWAEAAVGLARDLQISDKTYSEQFAAADSMMLSLLADDGSIDLYHGGIWAQDTEGNRVLNAEDYRDYRSLITEEVKNWSYMKFPYLTDLGRDKGWYRVGPLARINNCVQIGTPRAEQARQEFRALQPAPIQTTLAYHWTRMIELLHCAEVIEGLLRDDDLLTGELVIYGDRRASGIGAIEAPRGTLIHDYEVDDNGLVTRANLIVSTTHNNTAMNRSISSVANEELSGQAEVTEPLLNKIEIAVRAYDPCLSCATHALGRMPLRVEVQNADGKLCSQGTRDSQGRFEIMDA